MRFHIAAASISSLLLMAVPVHATKQSSTKKPKLMTLKHLAELAKAKGEASPLDEPRGGRLGYKGPYQMRDHIVADLTSDTQIAILAILNPKTESLYDVILTSTTITEWNGEQPISINGYSYRANLSGKLIAALHVYGKVGAVTQEKIEFTKEVKTHFEAVRSDLLRIATSSTTVQ